MMANTDADYSEAASIGMKILGVLISILSFMWLVNIFKGPDRKLDKKELKELVALLFFVAAGGYMIFKEGERVDLTHEVYGLGWISVVFGSLLTVLHLEKSLELILKIMQAFVEMRKGAITQVTKVAAANEVNITSPEPESKVQPTGPQ